MVLSEGNKSLKNPVTPPGIDSGTVRLVSQHLNHYATPGPQHMNNFTFIITRAFDGHIEIIFRETRSSDIG
jgi:hypothetical protein